MFKANIQYGKIITTQNVVDWELAPEKTDYEVSKFSTKETFLKDVIDSLAPINSGQTNKLEICIKTDDKGRIHIIRKWPVKNL